MGAKVWITANDPKTLKEQAIKRANLYQTLISIDGASTKTLNINHALTPVTNGTLDDNTPLKDVINISGIPQGVTITYSHNKLDSNDNLTVALKATKDNISITKNITIQVTGIPTKTAKGQIPPQPEYNKYFYIETIDNYYFKYR